MTTSAVQPLTRRGVPAGPHAAHDGPGPVRQPVRGRRADDHQRALLHPSPGLQRHRGRPRTLGLGTASDCSSTSRPASSRTPAARPGCSAGSCSARRSPPGRRPSRPLPWRSPCCCRCRRSSSAPPAPSTRASSPSWPPAVGASASRPTCAPSPTPPSAWARWSAALALLVDEDWAYISVFFGQAVLTGFAAWNTTRLPRSRRTRAARARRASGCCATARTPC